jgi:hypothetical protein
MTSKKESKRQPAEPASTAQAPKAPKPDTPTPAPAPQSVVTNRQTTTVAKLKAAWTEKGIKLDQLSERQDGKYTLLQPTSEWPIIRIGPTGGIELPQIRSYAKAWDAAVDGLAVWTKQQQRDHKRGASSAPAAVKPQATPVAPKETPAIRKQKDHNKLEATLA